jgi:uncharacterized phage-like protein YoqJ
MEVRPKVWELRAEDVDEYRIIPLGVFSSRNSAVQHLIEMLTQEIRDDVDGYEEWVDEEGSNQEREVYIKEHVEELKKKIQSWINTMETPMPKHWKDADKLKRKQSGIFWGIYHYVISEIPSYLNIQSYLEFHSKIYEILRFISLARSSP